MLKNLFDVYLIMLVGMVSIFYMWTILSKTASEEYTSVSVARALSMIILLSITAFILSIGS